MKNKKKKKPEQNEKVFVHWRENLVREQDRKKILKKKKNPEKFRMVKNAKNLIKE